MTLLQLILKYVRTLFSYSHYFRSSFIYSLREKNPSRSKDFISSGPMSERFIAFLKVKRIYVYPALYFLCPSFSPIKTKRKKLVWDGMV